MLDANRDAVGRRQAMHRHAAARARRRAGGYLWLVCPRYASAAERSRPAGRTTGSTLFDLVQLRLDLMDALGRDVDVVTYGALNSGFRERVLREQEVLL